MFSEIRIYYEGHRNLGAGFDTFFVDLKSLAHEHRCGIHLISGGGREKTCRDFGIALRTNRNAWNILLIDSEGPLPRDASSVLCRTHGWDMSIADSIFWMVEMMESWFHADKARLREFYGAGFNENALKSNTKVEEISKDDLKNGLSAATRKTKKGDYFENKTQHGPQLLAQIKPECVRDGAPNCERLFTTIRQKLSQRLVDIPE